MKKRLFAIMLALAMLLAAVPALAEEVEVKGTPKELVSDNESVTCTHENEFVKYVDNKDGTHKIIYDCGVIKNESVQHTFLSCKASERSCRWHILFYIIGNCISYYIKSLRQDAHCGVQ